MYLCPVKNMVVKSKSAKGNRSIINRHSCDLKYRLTIDCSTIVHVDQSSNVRRLSQADPFRPSCIYNDGIINRLFIVAWTLIGLGAISFTLYLWWWYYQSFMYHCTNVDQSCSELWTGYQVSKWINGGNYMSPWQNGGDETALTKRSASILLMFLHKRKQINNVTIVVLNKLALIKTLT